MAEAAQALLGLALGLCLIPFTVFLCYWRFRPRSRLITVVVPVGADPRPVRDCLVTAIRAYRYYESMERGPDVFAPTPWVRWLFGSSDIAIAPAAATLLVTCPAEFYGAIRRIQPAASAGPYPGREPLWPVVRGGLRLSGLLTVGLLLVAVLAYFADIALGLD
jgi:hypothetical protein